MRRRRGRPRQGVVSKRAVLGLAVGGVLLVLGMILGRALAPAAETPSTDSAAAGFLRDMQVHHAQAVEMALLVRDRTDNAEVRPPAPPMTWTLLPTIDGSDEGNQMDPSAPDGMPGMATPDQLAFLTLMIAHHQGGVEMADAALARTDVPQVVSLATGIRNAQRAEITVMQDLLAALPASN